MISLASLLKKNSVINAFNISKSSKINTFSNKCFSIHTTHKQNQEFDEQFKNSDVITEAHKNKDSKKLIFYYKKIEYQLSLSSNANLSVKEFLNIFAKKYDIKFQNSLGSKSYKDFEIFKNGRYAPNEFLINKVDTRREDPSPFTLVDFDINFENLKYRNVKSYSNPIEAHSNKLQVFLNSFLNNVKVEKFDNNFIHNMIQKNTNYYLSNSTGLEQLAASFIGVDNPDGIFKFSQDLNLSNVDRGIVKNISFMKSNVNNFVIPLTVVKNAEKKLESIRSSLKISEYNKDKDYNLNWNIAIVENLDKIRKITLKNNLAYNFGIVTDYETWQINFYVMPLENFIETDESYQSSLKYNINLRNLTHSDDNYYNFIKIVKGISQMSKKDAKSLEIVKDPQNEKNKIKN